MRSLFPFAGDQGLEMDTHNFYYLCDETTGNYIDYPESSPEIVSISSTATSDSKKAITDNLRTELMNKVTCLLKQTNPANKYLDYETDCGLPLHYKIKSSTDGTESSVVTPENNTVENIGGTESETDSPSKSPSESPSGYSTTVLISNQPTTGPTFLDMTDISDGSYVLEPGAVGKEDEETTALLRPPSSQSTTSLVTMPKYAIIIASLLLLLVPCALHWVCREFCRSIVMKKKAKGEQKKLSRKSFDANARKRSSKSDPIHEIEKELLQAAITTNDTLVDDLEVGSATIYRNGFRIGYDYGWDYTKSVYPKFWQKIFSEFRRQAMLRSKWNVVTVSGVVIGPSSATTVATELASGMVEPSPGILLESNQRKSEEDGENQEHLNEDANHSDFDDDDDNSILELDESNEESGYCDEKHGGEIGDDNEVNNKNESKGATENNIQNNNSGSGGKSEDRDGSGNSKGDDIENQNEGTDENSSEDEANC